jgi:hypothetical protein
MAVLQDLTRSLDSLSLSNNPGKREALATAFRAMWKRAKIDELEQRIVNFRQQLVLGLVVTLRCVKASTAASVENRPWNLTNAT